MYSIAGPVTASKYIVKYVCVCVLKATCAILNLRRQCLFHCYVSLCLDQYFCLDASCKLWMTVEWTGDSWSLCLLAFVIWNCLFENQFTSSRRRCQQLLYRRRLTRLCPNRSQQKEAFSGGLMSICEQMRSITV